MCESRRPQTLGRQSCHAMPSGAAQMSAVVTSFLSFCTAGVYQSGCWERSGPLWNWAVFKIPVDWWVYLFVSVLSNTGNYHNPWEPCVELEPLKRCKGLVSMTDWEWIVMLLNAASKTKASAQWDGSHVWWKRSEMEKHSSWNHLKHLKTLVKDPKRDKQWNIAKDVHRFSPSNSFPFWIATTSSAAPAPVAAAGWMVPALSPIRWLWGYYLTAEAGPGRVDDAGNHVKTE